MKKIQLNPSGLICLVAACYCMYYLLNDNDLPFSINFVLSTMNHWILHWHVLVIGFLPIYVACMLFGAGLLGLYLGNNLQYFFVRLLIGESHRLSRT